MFVDCSEIGLSVIVKHVQHAGVFLSFSFLTGQEDLLSFSVPGGCVCVCVCVCVWGGGGGGGGGRRIAGLWFARGIGTQTDTGIKFPIFMRNC